MASFKDNAGRTWQVELDAWAIKQVKTRTGVNIGRFLDDRMKPYVEFLGDPALVMDVLWVLVESQAAKVGVTDEQFGRSLGGDAGADAVRAFSEAFETFSPSRQRTILRALTAKGKELEEATDAAILKRIAAIPIPEAAGGGSVISPTSATAAPESAESARGG